MTPLKLKLSGFIGIRDGLGLQSAEIDFAQFADAQLIALKGPNGAGKSTILDNLHPYRIMPSRAGGYSIGSFSYYDQTFGDAERVLEWEHDGQAYRSQILIKGAGKQKKTEAYLHRIDVEPAQSLSDGKAATYDAAVESILGTPEMYFTAAFAAQGRRSLSSYTNGEIKGLMSELLGLDHILELGTKANDVAKLLTARLNGLNQQLGQFAAKEQAASALSDSILGHKSRLSAATEFKTAARQAVQDALQALAKAKADAQQVAEIESRRTALTNQITAAQTTAQARVGEIQADIEREQSAMIDNSAKWDADRLRIFGQVHQANVSAGRAQQLLDRRVEIEQAVNDLPLLTEHLADADGYIVAAQAEVDKIASLETQKAELSGRFATAGADGKRLAEYVEGLIHRAELADKVPCGGTDLQDRCPLLTNAVTARAEIPAKGQELAAKRAECETIKIEGLVLVQELVGAAVARQTLLDAKAKRQGIEQQLTKARTVAALAESLAQAGDDHAHAAGLKAVSEASLAALADTHAANKGEIEQRITALGARAAAAQESARAEIQAFQEQLADIPATVGSEAVTQAQAAYGATETEQARIEQDIESTQRQLAGDEARLETLHKEVAAATTARADAARITTEIAHWRLLTTALGNDGIVALSIDDAGPTLASITNDLLLSCYGPRFTVSIQTQAETAKGDQKETFDILVFDGERDESKSVRDMSGGERVYINDTLTRAIALYQAQQSGRHYGTLFADESDGALDPDRKVQFMKMKRRILEIGGYEREFLITHTPDLIDLADAVLDVGGMRVA